MAAIGIKQLKARTSSVIDQVAAGTAYVVTKRGRPVAVLMPIADAEDAVLEIADKYVRRRSEARADHARGRSVDLADLRNR